MREKECENSSSVVCGHVRKRETENIVDSFHLCRLGCEDTKSERARERESEREWEKWNEQDREREPIVGRVWTEITCCPPLPVCSLTQHESTASIFAVLVVKTPRAKEHERARERENE